jgi:ferredoxin
MGQMKSVQLTPIGDRMDVATGTSLLEGLLSQKLQIDMACGGRGLCATCHVYVRQGHDCLSPVSAREERTLSLVDRTDRDSRLACQCHVLGEGIVVELPEGMYVRSAEQIVDLIGQRAEHDYLHPLTGKVLIPQGKIITRTVLSLFASVIEELRRIQTDSQFSR